MSQPPRTMGAIETAVIVFRYLEGQHFSKTLKAFKREAKDILAMAPQVPRGLKPLAVMLGEYVALREADERRAHLFARNPALRDMFQIIETQSAALQPTYAGQFTGAAPPSAAGEQMQAGAEAQSPEQEDNYSGAPAAGDLNGDFSALQGNFSTLGGGHNHNGLRGNYGATGNTPGASPRKTIRKRAPKRKLPAAHEAHAQLDQFGDGFGASMIDLLNQPINERALETLLAGDWQGRFAEGLASCINDRLAPQQQQEQLVQLAAQSAAAALPVYDEVEMNTWMASLTGDPGMAALLEPIVAPPQGMDGSDEGGCADQDMQLDEPHDASPSEQHPRPEASPEMEHGHNEPQQGTACSGQERDQAGTPTPVDSSHAAKLAAPPASGEPPHAPDLAVGAAAASAPQAPSLEAAEQAPAQASGGDARPPPAAAQKARRRLSLEPPAFPPAAAAAAERQLAAARPLGKETGAARVVPDMTAAQPTQDELFAEAVSGPNTSPFQPDWRKDGAHSGGRRGTTAEPLTATPKLSGILSDPMSTLDGFSAHVLAAKARSAVPSAEPSAAANGASDTPKAQHMTDARMHVAGAQRSADGKGAASIPPSEQKGRSGSTARVVSASNVEAQSSGGGFFGDPVSTLDGFQGDILAASARAVPASAAAALPSAAESPPVARQGTNEQERQRLAQPNTARSRAAPKPVAQQRRGRKGGVARGVPAAKATPSTQGTSIFGEPINTLDGFSGDILSARAAATASAARPQTDAAVSTPPMIGNISFLDAMPTLDGFPADDDAAAAARPHAPAGEASRRLPGNRGGAAAALAAQQALSPIPLRVGPDGRLSSPLAILRNVDSSARTVPAEWRGAGAAAAGRGTLPDQARQGIEDVHSGQERGIWRSEESMDAVLRDPSPAPEQAAAAAQRPRQAVPSGAAAVEAPATDFSGLHARIGAVAKGSSCAQQQGGGNARALSSIFAGGASAESLDAFMRSLKY
ncbi:hypothetical protein COCOBI_04-8210 [Coccomyxa sp. Obi]|nr:hypothetical protein COCOBI_04-8210 [Coccomyxa sp. Obi]